MGIILAGDHGRRLYLRERSGSHSIAAAWLEQREPQAAAKWQREGGHPARYLSVEENVTDIVAGCELGVVLRNPVERFRSMCARHRRTPEHMLADPISVPLPPLPYTVRFRFEDNGLLAAAEWLGLSGPLPSLAESDEVDKPVLTEAQAEQVRAMYAADLEAWVALQAGS